MPDAGNSTDEPVAVERPSLADSLQQVRDQTAPEPVGFLATSVRQWLAGTIPTEGSRAGRAFMAARAADRETLVELAHDDDPLLRAVAARVGLPLAVQLEMLADETPSVRASLAASTYFEEVVDHLSGDEDGSVRAAAGANPCLTDVERLRDDDDPRVRVAVAGRGRSDAMATDHDPEVRAVVAHTTGSADVLATLVGDLDPTVRAAALTNPLLLSAEVERLAGDVAEEVRETVAKTTGSPATLDRLATDSSPAVRLAAASNPSGWTDPRPSARFVASLVGLQVIGGVIAWVIGRAVGFDELELSVSVIVVSLLVLTTAVERLLEPLSERMCSDQKADAAADKERLTRRKQATTLVASTLDDLWSSRADLDLVDHAMNVMGQAQGLELERQAIDEQLRQADRRQERARRERIVYFWALASLTGMLISALSGVRVLSGLGFASIPEALDVGLTGIIIGGGTKPIHDLIGVVSGLAKSLD